MGKKLKVGHGLSWVLGLAVVAALLLVAAVVTLASPWPWYSTVFGFLCVAIPLGLGMVVNRVGVELFQTVLMYVAPLAQGITFGVVSSLVGDSEGAISFYTVSAQLIPVLALALMLQTAAFDIRAYQELRSVRLPLEVAFFLGIGIALIALAAAEHRALSAVFHDKPSGADVIAGGIAAAFIGLVLQSLARVGVARHNRDRERG